MKILSHISIALHGINQNRLRGFLSILGVVVGVVAVIGMGALAWSMQSALASRAESLGANTFSVERASDIEMALSWFSGNRTESFELWRRPRFDLNYVDEIMASCPSVKSVAPIANGSFRMRFGSSRSQESINYIGTNENFLQGGIYKLEDGRFLRSHDVETRRYVCVIGQQLVSEFFPNVDPIGQTLYIGQMPCQVIGTLEKVGSTLGENPDEIAIMPITTAIKHNRWMVWQMKMNIEAYPEKLEEATDEVISTLRRIRGLAPEDNNNFSIVTSDMMKEIYGKITGAAAIVVLIIAGVSLIVAGIGIMNVMFVSVKERTREIGIRKACGASSKDILIQFTLEAIMLSSFGGIIGMTVVGVLINTVGRLAPFDIIFPPGLIAMGLFFSMLVGVVFGIVPAIRASKMNVVDALRYE
jgi:putative ABC transport system permease protein